MYEGTRLIKLIYEDTVVLSASILGVGVLGGLYGHGKYQTQD